MKKTLAATGVLFAFLLAFHGAVCAEAPATSLSAPAKHLKPSALQDAIDRAQTARLWDKPLWTTLGHYRNGKSLVDDPAFFLSPSGKTNPQEELLATLSALFAPGAGEKSSPASRFPARAAFLADNLGLSPEDAPGLRSAAFEEIYAALEPCSVSLVFASSTMNSPASMFGHTFLIVDSASGSRLTAGAINYAALTEDAFGFVYTFKGLFGYYKGYYSMRPYHEKIKEYADIAHRDLWEYPVGLTGPEIRRMLAHVFELNGLYSNYYFVGENCSLGLLFLLDAARPGLGLAGKTGFMVIPSDTVRMAREAGIAGPGVMRPSAAEKMRQRAAFLSPGLRRLALAAANGNTAPDTVLADAALSDKEKSQVLDLAADTLGYLYTSQVISKDDYIPRFRKTLAARSLLSPGKGGGSSGWPDGEMNGPGPKNGRVSPDNGHRPSLLSLSGGARDGKGFSRLEFRAAGHGLTDPSPGYPEGSQVIAGRVVIEFPFDGGGPALDRLTFLDMVSLAPRDDLFSPLSWKTRAGYVKAVSGDGGRHGTGELEIAKGLCARFFRTGLAYVFFGARAEAGSGLDDGWAAGPALEAGMLLHPAPTLSFHFSGFAARFFPDTDMRRERLSIETAWAIRPNAAFVLDAGFSRDWDFSETSFGISAGIFF